MPGKPDSRHLPVPPRKIAMPGGMASTGLIFAIRRLFTDGLGDDSGRASAVIAAVSRKARISDSNIGSFASSMRSTLAVSSAESAPRAYNIAKSTVSSLFINSLPALATLPIPDGRAIATSPV